MQSQNTYSFEEVLQKLKKYCVYQERCHQEVHQKLKTLKTKPEDIDSVVVELKQYDFLNEKRYAKSFVSGKFKIKKWGRNRLTLELKKRSVPNYLINSALNEIDEQEYITVFNSLAEKKYNSISETNKLKKKKKLVDYLLQRGWESQMVYDKANILCK